MSKAQSSTKARSRFATSAKPALTTMTSWPRQQERHPQLVARPQKELERRRLARDRAGAVAHRFERALDRWHQCQPRLGQCHRARGALEQPGADGVLELPNLSAERRGRQRD